MSEIVAYCSHSYRPEDREVNMAIWKRLNAVGIEFVVDPPGEEQQRAMDVTFAERLMRVADCFVAIVPDRSWRRTSGPSGPPQAIPAWSPYQALEYRLALRANKPRLVIVEQKIDQGPLCDDESTQWFRRHPFQLSPDFDKEVDWLSRRAQSRPSNSPHLPKLGLLRWAGGDPRWNTLIGLVQAGHRDCRVIDVNVDTPDHLLLADARETSVLVVDVNPKVVPAEVLGLLHGAAVPLYRTCLLEAGEAPEGWLARLGLSMPDEPAAGGGAGTGAPTHRLLQGYRVDKDMAPVRFWAEASAAHEAMQIVAGIRGYYERERRLEAKASARDYFLGMRGNRVFVSTPGDLNDFTEQVAQGLKEAGMPAFHYKLSEIPSNAEWKPFIESEVRASDLLLGFISATYWDRKECVDELALAIRRWESHEMRLLLYAADGTRQGPAYLTNRQINTLATGEAGWRGIVDEVRQRFKGPSGDAGTDEIEKALERLFERHLPLRDPSRLGALLQQTCGLPEVKATAWAARVSEGERPAAVLVRAMSAALNDREESRSALGRMCLYLRLRERVPADRGWLDGVFSRLRLFPGLHDIQAWNDGRKRHTLRLTLQDKPDDDMLQVINRLAGGSLTAMSVVAQLGDALARRIVVPPNVKLAELADPRITIACDIEQLALPYECASIAGIHEPLSRAWPVSRQIIGLATGRQRAALETRYHHGLMGPPRVLLFGYPSRSLPLVSNELQELESIWTASYLQRGWPTDLIHRVPAEQATREHLLELLQTGDHEVIHLAGHAGFDADTPVLQVQGEGRSGWVREELGQALANAGTARFVYLSCCEGAATAAETRRNAAWRQSLAKELLEAGVPEIMAYLWPVGDQHALRFARVFHEAFVARFDAVAAVHRARLAFTQSEPAWAAGVLVAQPGPAA